MKQITNKIPASNSYLLLVFGLIVVFFKFYKLGYHSFSLDELYGVVAALEPNVNTFLESWILYDTNPPLYYFFLRIWLKVVPATEFWVRFPSVIFVLLASFYFIRGIKNRFQNTTWFYILLLFGTSFGFLFFAQEARAYGLLFLFVCLQLLYFIDLIILKYSGAFLKKTASFIVFSILSSYTHYTGIVFSSILILALLFFHRKESRILKLLLLSAFVCIVAGLPWLNYILFVLKIDTTFVINQDFSILKEIISMLFFGYTPIGKFLSIGFILLIAISIIHFLKGLSKIQSVYKRIILIGLISSVITLLSPFWPFFFQYRHYMIFIPIILLSISIIVSKYNLKKSTNNLLLLFGVVIVLSQGFTLYLSKREEWRQAVNYIVDTNKNSKHKVIVLGEPWQKSHKEYVLLDPGYLNISIRRKSFYQFYFNRFDKNHNLELVVIRPEKKELENCINQILKLDNKVFIISHAGEFQSKIKKLKLNVETVELEKKFYQHEVIQFVKKQTEN